MTTFVLVHGAWGGAHGFRHVRRILQAEGHQVFTPSLTGIGERVHLASPLVNLGTHVRDVVNQVLYEDLQDIVLVGYSYGGFVVTGTLEHIADRVRHLVYLDAFVPKDGESLASHVHGAGRSRTGIGEAWLVDAPTREFEDSSEGQWMKPRRTAHPRDCFTEPVHLARPLEEFEFTRTYIKATIGDKDEPGVAAFWRAAGHAAASPAWDYFEIETDHMVSSNKPVETARLLLNVVTVGN
jgi:pimeloyl-ACP methyl ester carboxylesterase